MKTDLGTLFEILIIKLLLESSSLRAGFSAIYPSHEFFEISEFQIIIDPFLKTNLETLLNNHQKLVDSLNLPFITLNS